MNNIRLFEGNRVEVVEVDDKVLFNARDVAEVLDISHSALRSDIAKMNDKQVIKLTNSAVRDMDFRKLNNRGENFLTKAGISKLLAISRNSSYNKKRRIANRFDLDIRDVFGVATFKEAEFFSKLQEILIPFNLKMVRQYVVLEKYRIDLYIPELKIAIEYDENNHKKYSYEAQELRQELIEEELGCKFIRVSDDNTDEFNIGVVLKNIMTLKGVA